MAESIPNDGENSSYGYISPTAVDFESVSGMLEPGIDDLTTSVSMTEPLFFNQLEIFDNPSSSYHSGINDRSASLPPMYIA